MTIWEVYRTQISMLRTMLCIFTYSLWKQISSVDWRRRGTKRRYSHCWDGVIPQRLCGFMYNAITQLLTKKMTPFNAAKDSFVVLRSTASTEVSASTLSISSTVCVTKTLPQLRTFRKFVAKHLIIPPETFRQIFFLQSAFRRLHICNENVKFYFL